MGAMVERAVRRAGLGLALFMLTGAIGVSAAPWHFASPFPAGSLPVVNATRMAADLRALSGGAVDFRVSDGAHSPPHLKIMSAVGDGRLQAGEFMLAAQRELHPVMTVDTIPFLAITWFKARKLSEESLKEIDELLEEEGITILFSSPLPAPRVFSSRPIKALADFKGLKLWAPNPQLERFAELVEAEPVNIKASRLPAAFKAGQVEAMFASPEAGRAMAAWQFAPHLLNVPAWMPKSAVIVNTSLYRSLKEDQRRAMDEVVKLSEERAWRTAQHAAEAAVVALTEAGVSVHTASPAFRQELLAIGRKLTAEWTDESGDVGIAVVDRFLSLQL